MLVITSKLKRVKILRWAFIIILSPIWLPLYGISWLGELAEDMAYKITDGLYFKFEGKIAKKFKWDDVAKEQKKMNPQKFK
jgi:hypothetical protein